MNQTPDSADLWQFPCEFPIKIMGTNDQQLTNEVCAILALHVPNFNPEQDITTKVSSKGTYLAITANILAESKAQLDIIYFALNQHPMVKVTL